MEADKNIYIPASVQPSLVTRVPENMRDDTVSALRHLREAVGGDVDAYVAGKLKMQPEELCQSLAAEQVDGVALAIYNIEERKQGLIIGDQTGLGKGRQAAAMIRYASLNGFFPVFFTAKVNLFSDLYRDMKALESENMCPLLLNSGSRMVDYGRRTRFSANEDEDEPNLCDFKTVWRNDRDFDAKVRKAAAEDFDVLAGEVTDRFDYLVSTYSQLNKGKDSPRFLLMRGIVRGRRTIFILDESHEAAGDSKSGRALAALLHEAAGCVFLSATFAKRPENLYLYSSQTALRNAGVDDKRLIDALKAGGLPLQEMISSQLVHHGQMLRREKDYHDVDVAYQVFRHSAEHDVERYDRVVTTLRDILEYHDTVAADAFGQFNEKVVQWLEVGHVDDKEYVMPELRRPHAFASVPGVVEALNLAIKAGNIAAETMRLVREGNKVVIALSKTAGSSISRLTNTSGEKAHGGQEVQAGFEQILLGALRRTHHIDGIKDELREEIKELIPDGDYFPETERYWELHDRILATDYDLPMAPIDIMLCELQRHGVSVAECTGRTMRVNYSGNGYKGRLEDVKREPVDWIYNEFQNNRYDVLIINSTGATGASAHAIPTPMVPESEVKRRVMIIAQPELNVNTEIQKRGRINRIGQLPWLMPRYVYVSSVVPHERRTLMMLKRKLKSLDANTSSWQHQSDAMLDCADFCNKYGDEVVRDWLEDNPGENLLMGRPMGEQGNIANLAVRTTGRLSVLDCAEQERFYADVIENYENKIQLLIDDDDFDLETIIKDYQAVPKKRKLLAAGDNTVPFGGEAYIGTYECQVHRKPWSYQEVVDAIRTGYPDFNPNDPATYHKHKALKKVVKKFYESACDDTWVLIKDEEARARAIERLNENCKNICSMLDYFFIGRYVRMTIENNQVPAIVIGVKTGKKLTPGQISVEFAVAHWTRTRSYNCVRRLSGGSLLEDCGLFRLKQIRHESEWKVKQSYMGLFESNWNTAIRKHMTGIISRNIVTGNIVRSYVSSLLDNGRHVVFSTKDGTYRHGVLISDETMKRSDKPKKVLLPIRTAIETILKSHNCLSTGNSYRLAGGIENGVNMQFKDRFVTFFFNAKKSLEVLKDICEENIHDPENVFKTGNSYYIRLGQYEKEPMVRFFESRNVMVELDDFMCGSVARTSSQYEIMDETEIWPKVNQ